MKNFQCPRRIFVLFASCVLIAVAMGGCDDDPAALAPFEPEISNAADSFSMQATGVKNVTTTVSYTWSNSETRATINHSTTSDVGTASLEIRDSAGTVVYDKNLVPSLNEESSAGVAGDWTIKVKLTGYTGTLNFTAQAL